MKIINTFTKQQLDELYNESALTFEGLDTSTKNLEALMGWLVLHNAIVSGVQPTFHITTGRLMNKYYGLTGDNAYHNDLNLVSVTNIDQMKIAIPRFEVGGRWFDDIVDNNARREEE